MVGRHRALVAPEEVGARPVEGHAGEAWKERRGDRSARKRDQKTAACGDGVTALRLEPAGEALGQGFRLVNERFHGHSTGSAE